MTAPNPVTVQIMRWQAGSGEFRLQPPAKTFHAGIGENQHRTRSGKPLHLVAGAIAGQLGGLQQAGSTG